MNFFFHHPISHSLFPSPPLPHFSRRKRRQGETGGQERAVRAPVKCVCGRWEGRPCPLMSDGGTCDSPPDHREAPDPSTVIFHILSYVHISLFSFWCTWKQTDEQTDTQQSVLPTLLFPFSLNPYNTSFYLWPHVRNVHSHGASVTGVTVSYIRDTSLSFSRPPSCLDLAPFWVYMHTHMCIYT